MSVFSGQFNWNEGLIWQVGFIDAAKKPNGAESKLHICPVLVDTGASRTCVARSVIDALDLQPIGKVEMQTAGGLVSVNAYDVHVAFIVDFKQNPDGSHSGQAQLTPQTANTQALEFDPGKSIYQGLIGRDILRYGVLILSMDGHYSFSY